MSVPFGGWLPRAGGFLPQLAVDLPDASTLLGLSDGAARGLNVGAQPFLEGAGWAFQAVAFLVLLVALVSRLADDQSTGELVRAVAVPVLCAACAAVMPDIGRQANAAGWELVSGSGYAPQDAAARWSERASPWLRSGSPLREALARERLPVDWMDDLWAELESGRGLSETSSAGLWSLAGRTDSGRASLWAGSAVGVGLVGAAALNMWCSPVHGLVVDLLLLLVPLACAGLAWERGAAVARGCLVRVFAVAFWPLGWTCLNWVGGVLLDTSLDLLHPRWSAAGPGALLDALAVMPSRGACMGLVGCLVSTIVILLAPLAVPVVLTLLLPGVWHAGVAAGAVPQDDRAFGAPVGGANLGGRVAAGGTR